MVFMVLFGVLQDQSLTPCLNVDTQTVNLELELIFLNPVV